MRFKSICLGIAIALLTTGCQRCCQDYDCYVDQQYFHKYGEAEVGPSDWAERGGHGRVVTTLRDGVVVSQNYANGSLNGEATYTYPNSSQIQRKEVYSNDELVHHTEYHPSGQPDKSIQYSSPEIWTETAWYETGLPRSVEKFERGLLITGEYYNPKNQRDSWVYNGIGERLTRDQYGHFISQDTFRGGQLVTSTTFYPNNNPKEVTPYDNGRIHGERKTYYPGGDPMAIETWTNGIQNGTTILFQNGEKYAEVPYLGGKKEGIEKRFRDGSVVTQEISWHNSKMHGPTYTYVGQSTQTDWFYEGRLTTRSNYESFALPKMR